MDAPTHSPSALSPFWQLPALALSPIGHAPLAWRFYQIRAIIDAKPLMHRLAMSNVIANMNQVNHAMVYMIASDQHGVRFYLGVVGASDEVDELALSGQLLKSAFEGNFLGAELHDAPEQDIAHLLGQRTRLGLLTGVPSLNSNDPNSGDEESQGIERLVNSLAGECWQFIILAQPTEPATTRQLLGQILAISTELSSRQKRSVQTAENTGWQKTNSKGSSASKATGTTTSNTDSENNSSTGKSNTRGTSDTITTGSNDSKTNTESGGSSTSTSHDMIDKGLEEMQKHLSEVQIPRFRLGQSKGMFRSAIYVSADSKGLYQRLSHSVLSIFQGNKAGMTPLQLHPLDPYTGGNIGALFTLYDTKLKKTERQAELIHSIAASPTSNYFQGATWLTSEELALLMGIPGKELPGLPIRKSVDFALNPGPTAPPAGGDAGIALGNVIQHGKTLAFKTVNLARTQLHSHLFVCGVTGSGKTTTCMKILLASKQPFLVLEPAKTEYRALLANDADLCIFPLGHPNLASFRLNPFELVSPRENLSSHIAILTNTLAAVFPMEAAMPYLVEEAIINAYKRKGWHIHQSRNYLHDDPFAPTADAWPTFSDLLGELDGVVRAKKMGTEFTEKYLGSLLARLSNLTLGIKGRLLNNARSINFDALLDQRVVIELDEIKDEGDKALLMGLIITRLAECMKQRHQTNPGFRHLTLIEEAHRLLSRPEPGEGGSKKLGVDMFCNLLAEVRKYGEGLIIAEQIPNKLVPDVIKNTNTKIVHRLFSADDRDVIGNAMAMRDEQKDFLPLLRPGEAVMYSGGWHAPVLLKIHHDTDTSRNPIAEQRVLEQETLRQWQQREVLFPHLAQSGLFGHAAQLAQGQQQFAAIWSLILALLQLRAQERPTHLAPRQAIANRLARQVGKCSWQNDDLAQGLVAYLLDHASVGDDAVKQAELLCLTRFFAQADAGVYLTLQTALTNRDILTTMDTWLKNGTLYHLH